MEQTKTKNWWIYQQRNVPDKWAMHLTARKERRNLKVDVELYADYFYNGTFKIIGMDLSNINDWLSRINKVLSYYGKSFNDTDINQIKEEINNLKASFLD